MVKCYLVELMTCILISSMRKCLFITILILKRRSGEKVDSLSGHSSWILGLSYSSLGSYFVSSAADKKVKIWSVADKECVLVKIHFTKSSQCRLSNITQARCGAYIGTILETILFR
jgi:WD40 repeat protein